MFARVANADRQQNSNDVRYRGKLKGMEIIVGRFDSRPFKFAFRIDGSLAL
jgi:hypothetical protein